MAVDENAANNYLLQIYGLFVLLVAYQKWKFSQAVQFLLVVDWMISLLPSVVFKAMSEGLQKGIRDAEKLIIFLFFFFFDMNTVFP